jgi:hypothetical protein
MSSTPADSIEDKKKDNSSRRIEIHVDIKIISWYFRMCAGMVIQIDHFKVPGFLVGTAKWTKNWRCRFDLLLNHQIEE